MPRNSTLLKFRTTNSCPTLETPYKVAPPRHRRSPSTLLEPSERKGKRILLMKHEKWKHFDLVIEDRTVKVTLVRKEHMH